jgi:hypothetical protein
MISMQDAISTRILTVQGLGGPGKSQLVLDYVRKYRESTIRRKRCIDRYLALQGTVLGKGRPSILTSMNNLALMLSNQGKYDPLV